MKFIRNTNIIQQDYYKDIGYIWISNEEIELNSYSPFPYIGEYIENYVLVPVRYYKKSDIVKFYKNEVKNKSKHKGEFTHLGLYDNELPLWACKEYENFINGKSTKIRNFKYLECFLENLHTFTIKYPDEMLELWSLKQANIGNHILFFEGTDDASYAKKFKTYKDVEEFLNNICFEKLNNLLYWN